jgi:poly(3-hydroxybutyrate) depolymerase
MHKLGDAMLYDAYEVQRSMMAGASRLAGLGAGWLNNPSNPFSYSSMGPVVAAGLGVFAHASAERGKPEFGLETTTVGRKVVAIEEQVALRKPFGQMKHFAKAGVKDQPPLLIVAPMSGHYATLLRGTVERMLPRHDVFITDWRDASAQLVPAERDRNRADDAPGIRAKGVSGFPPACRLHDHEPWQSPCQPFRDVQASRCRR